MVENAAAKVCRVAAERYVCQRSHTTVVNTAAVAEDSDVLAPRVAADGAVRDRERAGVEEAAAEAAAQRVDAAGAGVADDGAVGDGQGGALAVKDAATTQDAARGVAQDRGAGERECARVIDSSAVAARRVAEERGVRE